MTNYPITEPAEIAKLPLDTWFKNDVGTLCARQEGGWMYVYAEDQAVIFGAEQPDVIAGRLVLEASPRSEDRIRKDAAIRVSSAEAQRDRAVELLRRGVDLLEQDHGCDDSGVEKFGRGYCDLHDFAADARAALAKLGGQPRAVLDVCTSCHGREYVTNFHCDEDCQECMPDDA